jgi:hypothetical protein
VNRKLVCSRFFIEVIFHLSFIEGPFFEISVLRFHAGNRMQQINESNQVLVSSVQDGASK